MIIRPKRTKWSDRRSRLSRPDHNCEWVVCPPTSPRRPSRCVARKIHEHTRPSMTPWTIFVLPPEASITSPQRHSISFLSRTRTHSLKLISVSMTSRSIADLILPQITISCTTTPTWPPTARRNTSYSTSLRSTSTPPTPGRSTQTKMLNPRRQSAISPAPGSPSAIPRPHSVAGSHRPRLSSDAASQRASPEPDVRNVRVGTSRSTRIACH